MKGVDWRFYVDGRRFGCEIGVEFLQVSCPRFRETFFGYFCELCFWVTKTGKFKFGFNDV